MIYESMIRKMVCIVVGVYIGIFGIPGLAGKDQVQVSQRPPAAEQVQQESDLERVAIKLFGKGVSPAATSGDYEMPSDETLKQYLSQPVEETIGEEGVDYIKVTDEDYDEVVFNSDRPVMVLFYCNESPRSAGLAGLAKVLNDRFEGATGPEGHADDDILFCAYKVSDSDTVSYEKGQSMKNKYPIEDLPALIFYDNDSGEIEWMGKNWNYDGGIDEIDVLKQKIDDYMSYIPGYLLD